MGRRGWDSWGCSTRGTEGSRVLSRAQELLKKGGKEMRCSQTLLSAGQANQERKWAQTKVPSYLNIRDPVSWEENPPDSGTVFPSCCEFMEILKAGPCVPSPTADAASCSGCIQQNPEGPSSLCHSVIP